MKQTERKPDKTLADKQKEQAGATATFGQRDRTKYMPITVFAFGENCLFFPKELLLADFHFMISMTYSAVSSGSPHAALTFRFQSGHSVSALYFLY